MLFRMDGCHKSLYRYWLKLLMTYNILLFGGTIFMKKYFINFFAFLAILLVLNVFSNQTVFAKTSNAYDMSYDNIWSQSFTMNDANRDLWFKVAIPSAGIWNLKLMTYSSNAVWYDLYDCDALDIIRKGSNRLQNASESSPVGVSEKIALTKGIYYLNLHLHEEGEAGTAKIKIKSSFKKVKTNDNKANSFDSPQTIKIGQKITGILGRSDLEDWYKFKVKGDTTLVFKAKSYCDTFFTYDFYDTDAQTVYEGSNELQNATESSPRSAKRTYTFTKGTYYLRIKNYGDGLGGDGGKYIFSLSKK